MTGNGSCDCHVGDEHINKNIDIYTILHLANLI